MGLGYSILPGRNRSQIAEAVKLQALFPGVLQEDFQVVHGGVIQAAFQADAVTKQHECLVVPPRFLQPGEDFFPVRGELVVDALAPATRAPSNAWNGA